MRKKTLVCLLCALTVALAACFALGAEIALPGPAPIQPQVLPTPVPPAAMPAQPALAPEKIPTGPAAAAPAAAQIPIVDIVVIGSEYVSPSEITTAIGSKVGGFYSEDQLARDREAVLRMGWFQTVSAEREVVENGVRLVFRVRENPVVRDVRFEDPKEQPLRVMAREQLLAVMKTRPGMVYNRQQLDVDAQAIEELYRSKGYILAIVIGVKQVSEQGVLTLQIAEGEIESTKITGNTYTKTYVIQRYIHTKPGEVYSAKKVSADVKRITNTGYFESVRTDAEVGEQPGKIILIFIVVERQRTGQATVGGAYTSVQGLIGFVDLSKTNLHGTGQTVSIRGEFGGMRSYELGYRNPWIMSPETRLNLGIYDRFILRQAFLTTPEGQRNVLYRERRTGGNVVLGRPLSDFTTAYVGLRRDDVSLADISVADQQFLTGPAFASRQVRSLSLTTVTDTRENPNNPRGGKYHQFATEFAGIFGGSHFNKYSTDNRRYFPIGKKSVLAMRLIGGLVTGDAPYLEQFLIGGPDSLRGYRIDRFAGSHMVILNTEYRFPLSSNLTGVGFVDAGDAWGGPIASDLFFRSDKSFKTHLGYGVGVRIQTPVGPIRLDLGFSKEGAETHFGIANMF